MATEAKSASGQERLAYKHGSYVLAWVMIKRAVDVIRSATLLDVAKINAGLSAPFDELRQILWDATHNATLFLAGPPATYAMGPLALFRNQTHVVPLLQEVLIAHYGLSADPVLEYKKNLYKTGQPYPVDLFEYLVSKAPQIGSLV
jgi:hypothetical protein